MRPTFPIHPGIRIDRIPVQDFPGLVFAIGVSTLFIVGLPQLHLLALSAVAGGAVLAGLLYLWHNQTRW